MGGRREAENSGRSRVADRTVSGTVHNGLPARDLTPVSGARLALEGAASARPLPFAADDPAAIGGLKSARSSMGSAGARAARAEAITRMAPNSRISLMTAIAQ